ncbi:superoxide dismutase family protein [Roseovarius nanhaiticus]|uniref:superoxide dismutase family protein n=1 Tax=Roseovarius nanhaiticus TaxID=573024 RepID=UPI0024921F9A|nr:superoxide dismutase family protein [Roseovarius nanhaiticus]
MTRLSLMTAAALGFAFPVIAADSAAMAMMKTAQGADAGVVQIRQAGDGTLFQAELSGLAPGWHSFHVHEAGRCNDGFQAAGGHYAPAGNEHGLMAEGGAHAGDLPNIYVHSNGEAKAEFYSARLSIIGGDAPMMDEEGSAIVIHAQPDTYETEAEAGDRVACGVISQTK